MEESDGGSRSYGPNHDDDDDDDDEDDEEDNEDEDEERFRSGKFRGNPC